MLKIWSTKDDNNDIFFFDVVDERGETVLTDYHQMKKDIKVIVGEDGKGKVEIGGEKKRKKISTIIELQDVLKKCANKVKEILESDMGKIAGFGDVFNIDFRFDCSSLDIDLLVNQLVFDVLFNKYLKEAEEITLHSYARNMSKMIEGDINSENTIYKKLRDSMECDYKLMKDSKLAEELMKLGIDLDKYDKRYRTENNSIKKNPKYIWDYLYYNRYLITYRQFRRQSMKDSNNSYESVIKELKEYNDFVKKLLPVENESVEKYFIKSMEYYYLESYKRIDFMLNLAEEMPRMGMTEIDKEHFLIKRFHPEVLVLVEENGKLSYGYSKCNYYRPLFKIEEMIHKQMQCNCGSDESVYADLLFKYKIICAKTYEIFLYHNEYVSSDYKDIKDFIQKYYNMRVYHETNKVWSMIESTEWKQMDNETKKQIKIILRNFNLINEALFWKSEKREVKTFDDNNK